MIKPSFFQNLEAASRRRAANWPSFAKDRGALPSRRAARRIRHGLSVSIGLMLMTAPLQSANVTLDWKPLPPLPDPLGFAGAFAGISGNAFIVAGGANFPDKMPWEGGRKVWHDSVFVLEHTNGVWRTGQKLPRPLGYGVSVTTDKGLVCIGGSDSTHHVRDVFLLRWHAGKLTRGPMPALPHPLANACGALVSQTIYVAGGIVSPDATNALKNFWSLDLGKSDAAWRELPPWPGPARMLAMAATVGGDFYLVGGTDLAPDAHDRPVRTYLRDTYRFTPGHGWRRIADLPNPVVAAPTPAPVVDGDTFLIIGGDDGSLADFEPKSKHPGFPKRVLAYDTEKNCWSVIGETPASRATLPAVKWSGFFVFPSGESRPGVRSPEVWTLRASER